MLPSLYNGISGLQVHSRALAVNADNIANVNTVGFKNSRVSFANVYNRAIGGSAMEFGQGVDIAGVTPQWNSGSFQTTANALDLAIGGKGMFVLGSPIDGNDEVFYSRDGQFKFDKDGYLVAMNGMRVQGYEDGDPTGDPVDIHLGDDYFPFSGSTDDPAILATSFDRNGVLTLTLSDGSTIPGEDPDNPGTFREAEFILALADFADYTGLAKEGRNLYSASNLSGPAIVAPPGGNSNGLIAPGSLEMSNTDLATEFVAMISMQRGFQANSKTITTSDQVLEVLMTIKR